MNELQKIRARITLEDLRRRALEVDSGDSGDVLALSRVVAALISFIKEGDDLALDDRED